jgi:hypothetical protein
VWRPKSRVGPFRFKKDAEKNSHRRLPLPLEDLLKHAKARLLILANQEPVASLPPASCVLLSSPPPSLLILDLFSLLSRLLVLVSVYGTSSSFSRHSSDVDTTTLLERPLLELAKAEAGYLATIRAWATVWRRSHWVSLRFAFHWLSSPMHCSSSETLRFRSSRCWCRFVFSVLSTLMAAWIFWFSCF